MEVLPVVRPERTWAALLLETDSSRPFRQCLMSDIIWAPLDVKSALGASCDGHHVVQFAIGDNI